MGGTKSSKRPYPFTVLIKFENDSQMYIFTLKNKYWHLENALKQFLETFLSTWEQNFTLCQNCKLPMLPCGIHSVIQGTETLQMEGALYALKVGHPCYKI